MIALLLITNIKKKNKIISTATYSKIKLLSLVEFILSIIISAIVAMLFSTIHNYFLLAFGIAIYVSVSGIFLFEGTDLEFKTAVTNKYSTHNGGQIYHKRLKREDGYIISFKTLNFSIDSYNHKLVNKNDFLYSISKGIIISENTLDTIVLLNEGGKSHFAPISIFVKFIKDKEVPYIEFEEIDLTYKNKSPYIKETSTVERPSVLLVLPDEFIEQYLVFAKEEDNKGE